MEREVEERSLFISSCSRRELARRRPNRTLPPLPIAVIAVLLAMAAIGVLLAVRGTL
jgi:hypothetical protein